MDSFGLELEELSLWVDSIRAAAKSIKDEEGADFLFCWGADLLEDFVHGAMFFKVDEVSHG